MRFLTIAFTILGIAALVMAPPGAQGQPTRPSKRPPDLESLVADAVALPVEYQSDILFDLIDKGKLTDRAAKVQLLEDIFHHAGEARNPYAKVDHPEDFDTLSSRQALAFDLKLDTLSIQCRVARLILNDSGKKARELFAQIGHPALPPIPCGAHLIYNVQVYFDTLRELFDRAFTPSERRHGDDVQLLLQTISSIQSVEELAPAANMLASISVQPADWTTLANLFAGRVASVSTGDREFSYLEDDLVLSKAIEKLLGCELKDQMAPEGLLQAYRKFLVRQLSGPRCADSMLATKADPPKATDTRKFFNEKLAPLSPDQSFAIAKEDAAPSRILESAKVFQLQFPKPNGVIFQLDQIKNEPDGQSHEHGDWEQTISDILHSLEEEPPDPDICPECTFHQRAMLYLVLVDRVPPGPIADAVADSYLNFLAAARMQWDNPLEWLDELKYLLRLTAQLTENDRRAIDELHKKGKILNMMPGPQAGELLAKMRASRNPLISTYALKEMVAPTPYHVPALPK